MGQRLDQRLIGVLEAGIFADDGDRHFAFGIVDALDHGVPAAHVGLRRRLDAEGGEHLVVEPGGVIGARHVIDRADVARLDHRAFAHVAEQAELAALLARDFAVGAAQQDIRLDADRAQLLDRMLRRLGLQLAGRGNIGQQRQVDIDAWPRGSSLPSWRIASKNGRPSMSPTVPPISTSTKSTALIAVEDEFLDRVGDVRNDLHRAAEIIAAPLLGDDVLIDAAGGDIVAAIGRAAGEALVMAKVEIGLGAVVGDETSPC